VVPYGASIGPEEGRRSCLSKIPYTKTVKASGVMSRTDEGPKKRGGGGRVANGTPSEYPDDRAIDQVGRIVKILMCR